MVHIRYHKSKSISNVKLFKFYQVQKLNNLNYIGNGKKSNCMIIPLKKKNEQKHENRENL